MSTDGHRVRSRHGGHRRRPMNLSIAHKLHNLHHLHSLRLNPFSPTDSPKSPKGHSLQGPSCTHDPLRVSIEHLHSIANPPIVLAASLSSTYRNMACVFCLCLCLCLCLPDGDTSRAKRLRFGGGAGGSIPPSACRPSHDATPHPSALTGRSRPDLLQKLSHYWLSLTAAGKCITQECHIIMPLPSHLFPRCFDIHAGGKNGSTLPSQHTTFALFAPSNQSC